MNILSSIAREESSPVETNKAGSEIVSYEIRTIQLVIRPDPGVIEDILAILTSEVFRHSDIWIAGSGVSRRRKERHLLLVSPWEIASALIEQVGLLPAVIDVIVSEFVIYPTFG